MFDTEIDKFIEEICQKFPEVRSAIEKHEFDMPTSRMEEFANCTTCELGKTDPARGVDYLRFMSEKLKKASPIEHEYIDVYYAECLFWQAPHKTIKQGWPLVPENLKNLYVQFHV